MLRPVAAAGSFPVGDSVSLDQLEGDPHAVLAHLREREPVSWLPALDGWLITRHDLVLEVMRDPERFTVEDPRFSTSMVVGPSMLSLDGARHDRHRAPFVAPFRAAAVRARFAEPVTGEVGRLIGALTPAGRAELRREFAGPVAATTVARALGLARDEVPTVLAWYERIVAAVTEITAGRGSGGDGRLAFGGLRARLETAIGGSDDSLLAAAGRSGSLQPAEIVSNAAVLLFGGIETMEAMITNACLHLLAEPALGAQVTAEPQLLDAAIEESLRLEPAAAVIDRYATADVQLGDCPIGAGELVRLSIAAANRDPAVFPDPDRFDLHRDNARRHLAFAQGPHVCVGVHLARLEARAAIGALLGRLPGIRLDPAQPAASRGLVFRKPRTLHVVWDRV